MMLPRWPGGLVVATASQVGLRSGKEHLCPGPLAICRQLKIDPLSLFPVEPCSYRPAGCPSWGPSGMPPSATIIGKVTSSGAYPRGKKREKEPIPPGGMNFIGPWRSMAMNHIPGPHPAAFANSEGSSIPSAVDRERRRTVPLPGKAFHTGQGVLLLACRSQPNGELVASQAKARAKGFPAFVVALFPADGGRLPKKKGQCQFPAVEGRGQAGGILARTTLSQAGAG